MKNFLIINPFGIGDVLFTTPVISALKENIAGCRVSYWCNERVSGLFKDDPYIDKVFALSRGDLKKICRRSVPEGIGCLARLASALKKEKFDAAFDFSLDHRYGLICLLAGIKKRMGYDYKGRGLFLTDKINLQGYAQRHIVEYYMDVLKSSGIVPKTKTLRVCVSAQAKQKARQMLDDRGISENDLVVAIAPGAGTSWGKDARMKHWPIVRYAQLADRIIMGSGAKVVILGDDSEVDLPALMMRLMRNKPVDLVGKLSLQEFVSIIGMARLLVTNDGGPLHVAVAAGTRTVSIFGPVDERVYGPYPQSKMHLVITNDSAACRPCYKNFRLEPCLRERQCIDAIRLEHVYDAVMKNLTTLGH